MALTKLETIDDIRDLVVGIILKHDPTANVSPGFPLYDLVVTPFADLIYEERQSIHVLNNINKVLPLFNSDGTLIDDSFKDFLVNKYFIVSEYSSDNVYTAYIYTTAKCDLIIKSGSQVTLSGTTYEVTPIAIDSDSGEWKQENLTYYHPIELYSSETTQIPASDLWDISTLNWEVTDTSNAVISKVKTNYFEIDAADNNFNLDLLRNSISNRSFNNPRALRYHLSSNSGFTPTSLNKYEILKLRDRYFIDTYAELYKSRYQSTEFPTGFPVTVKTSNYSKVLLDYGYASEIVPITLEYTDDIYNHEYTSQLSITGDDANQIQSLVLNNGLTDNSYDNAYYWRLYKDTTVSPYKIKLDIATYDGSGYTSIMQGEMNTYDQVMTIVDTATGTTNYGQAVIKYSEDYAYDTEHIISMSNLATYKITLDNTDGVIAPLGIFYDNVSTTDAYAKANTYKTEYDSDDNDLINTNKMPCVINVSNTQKKFYSDDYGLFGKLNLNGLTSYNTDDFKLYWEVIKESGDTYHSLKIYSRNTIDRTDDNLVASAILSGVTDIVTINAENGSGISGDVVLLDLTIGTWGDGEYDVDYDNYIYFDNSIRAFSNNEIYIDLNITSGSLDQFDGEIGYMVALCSNSTYMNTAQETFSSSDNREIGNTVMVSAYRPIILSCSFSSDYIFPFKDNETNRTRYRALQSYLDTYLQTYTGKLSELDFSALVSDIQDETDLFLIRLDYVVCTQRGHLVRGYINLKDEDTATFNWGTTTSTNMPDSVIEIIENTIDSEYYNIHPELKESMITVEKMYKPVYSKVTL